MITFGWILIEWMNKCKLLWKNNYFMTFSSGKINMNRIYNYYFRKKCQLFKCYLIIKLWKFEEISIASLVCRADNGVT